LFYLLFVFFLKKKKKKQNTEMADEDDDISFDDDFEIGNDDMIRLLENEENQYRSTQIPNEERQDVLMSNIQSEPRMNIPGQVEESNVANLATTSNFGFNPHGIEEVRRILFVQWDWIFTIQVNIID
jgi:hypothetical protein